LGGGRPSFVIKRLLRAGEARTRDPRQNYFQNYFCLLPFFVRIDKVGRIFAPNPLGFDQKSGGIILKKINLLIFLLLSMLLTACSKNESIAQPQIDNDHLLFVTSVGNKISLNGTWKAKCVQTNSMDITETFVFADSVFTILIEMYEEGKCGACKRTKCEN
jgi:hypothetical protein